MSAHSNIAVFVPHLGCKHLCSFCNQNLITGCHEQVKAEDVDEAVKISLKSKNYDPENSEIAFFGGSFTAIEKSYMIKLLKAAYKYVLSKETAGIRISTRPDAINTEILDILKCYGVTSIELGAQSMKDEVLSANNRGHTAQDVYNASELIKNYGFSLGLQMMTGLYKSTESDEIYTAERFAEIRPKTVRIYPTITLKNTELEKKFYEKEYFPPTLEDSVKLCARLFTFFTECGIKVIRLGLHSIEPDSYVAGPWHPAFSELCQSEIMLKKIKEQLNIKGKYIIYVNNSFVSKTIGQKKSNIIELKNSGYDCRVKSDPNLKNYEIKIERCG